MESAKRKGAMLILLVVLAFAVLSALAFGAADIPFKEVKAFIFGLHENDQTLILKEIRMPRIAGALLAGMALAVSGAYMQGMTRNPMASPSLFGLTAGASALLSIGIVLLPSFNSYGVLLLCLLGSSLAGFLVFFISARGRHSLSNQKTVLAGAAVSTLLYALSDAVALRFTTSKQMTMWANSGLVGTNSKEILVVLPIILLGLILALVYRNKLTLVSLDEELALSLGENVRRLKVIFFFMVTFLTGAAIALSGSIVFLGLIVPHFVRRLVGGDYRHIVPFSIVTGGIFLVVADLLARVVNAPYETPVSAIMAVASYPIFLIVVKKGGRND